MTFATETDRAREAARTRELARIEDEAACDISAGPDLGPNLGTYLDFVATYGCGIDPERLKAFLQQELSRFPLFDAADVEAIVEATLVCASNRVQAKFQPKETPDRASQPAQAGIAPT